MRAAQAARARSRRRVPTSAPATPTQRAFARRRSATSRPRVRPSVRSSANCARRRATDSACVENTSRPPVNSATSASTSRFTRYARDSRARGRHAGLRRSRRQRRAAAAPATRCAKRSDVGARRSAQVDARQPAARRTHPARPRCPSPRSAGAAAAARVPATRSVHVARRRLHVDGVAVVHARASARRPALRNSASARSRSSAVVGVAPTSAGVIAAARNASTPTMRSASSRPRDRALDFDDGARDRDAVDAREQRIERFVEAGARPAHFEIGIAGQRRQSRSRSSFDRGTIDELRPRSRARRRARSRATASSERPRTSARTPPVTARATANARAERAHVSRHRALCAPRAVGRQRQTRSADAAAARECVTSTPAAPLRRARHRAAARSPARRCRGSRLPVGSSASTSAGRCTSARAIATRCSSPPESSRGMLRARSARPTAVQHRGDALARAAAPRSPSSASGSATFSRDRQVRQHVERLEHEAHVLAAQHA